MLLVLAPEREFGPDGGGPGFGVPELKAPHKAVTLQRDSAAMLATADHVADLYHFRLAVAVMDHNAVKLDGRVPYADLQEAITAGSLADLNVVMVMLAIDVRLAQVNPVRGMRGRSNVQQQRQSKKRDQELLHVLLSYDCKLWDWF